MPSDFTTEVSVFCVVSGAQLGCTYETLYIAQKYQKHIKPLGLQGAVVTLAGCQAPIKAAVSLPSTGQENKTKGS